LVGGGGCRCPRACARHCRIHEYVKLNEKVKKKRGGGRGSGYMYGVCSDLGGVLRATSLRLWSWAVFLRRQVSGFEMGRREHTINGAMAIDRVCDVLCGGGASLPLPPVAFFPPLPLAFVTRSSTSAALRLRGLSHRHCCHYSCCFWVSCHGGFV